MNKVQEQNLTNAGRGRPKGSQNKVTTEFRDTVKKLLEDNSDNVAIWLQQVAEGIEATETSKGREPAPEKALDLLAKLAEYAAPKLSRTEIAGDKSAPIVLTWQQ